ncbi:hypothetical protein GGF40_003589 [Coemansia sp. RSA 1286]|nr:hypothetical protein GGF40_003589 [Coemansia sp. RSA 1286]
MSFNQANSKAQGQGSMDDQNTQPEPISFGMSAPNSSRSYMGMNIPSQSVGNGAGFAAPPNSLVAGQQSLGAQQPLQNLNFNGSRTAARNIIGPSGKMQGIEAPPNSLATGQSMLAQGAVPLDFSSRMSMNPAGPFGSSENTEGSEAPPNSLAVPPAQIGQFVGSSSMGAGGLIAGFNPPPNTPAQASKIGQHMSTIRGSGMGGGQVPTGSFIDRRIALGGNTSRLNEADEDEDMDDQDTDDQEMNISPASFQNSRNKTNDDTDDMFPMEQ